jgi:hypothetical protein
MKAKFEIAANNTIDFDAPRHWDSGIAQHLTYRYSCCPFGWGTIYELEFDRQVGDVAIYKVVSSRSEKP